MHYLCNLDTAKCCLSLLWGVGVNQKFVVVFFSKHFLKNVPESFIYTINGRVHIQLHKMSDGDL